MKRLLAMCLAFASPAFAAEQPSGLDRHGPQDRQEIVTLLALSGTFGDGDACSLFAAGGIERVALAEPEGFSTIASAHGLAGPHWVCRPTLVHGDRATLACQGDETAFKTDTTFRLAGNVLTVSMEGQPDLSLTRCQ